jgi:S-formylglutathione hydrolase
MVFPDTSPRNCEIAELEGNTDWTIGYGAGHYCNATNAPYSTNFNMFTYVTEELPALVNDFFPVDPERMSVTGHSMGGNGALMVASRCRQQYRSASAFAPIGSTTTSSFCSQVVPKYFGGNVEEAKKYSFTDVVQAKKAEGVAPADILPPTLVSTGTADQFAERLNSQEIIKTAAECKLNLEFKWEDGYNHNYEFMATFMEEHVDFHAQHLKV